jgi:GTP-binding protein
MKITSAEFILSGTKTSHFPADNLPEVLFCGRSNVGKSSFINALVNRKALARTSSNPGKTQTVNFFKINNEFYLVDVPGYGYARVSKGMKESFGKMIEEYLMKREVLKKAFLLVDYRHEPTQDDVLMYQFLKYYNIPVCVIATKMDKLKNSELVKNKKAIIAKLQLKETDEFVATSSETKKGIEETLTIIENSIK